MKMHKSIVLAMLLAAMTVCLTGCAWSVKTSYVYHNGDKYTAGDRTITDKIETINIHYLSGDIELSAVDSDTVTIRETAKSELDDKRKVHTWVDGSTLYVKYCASAKGLDLNDLDKHLEITIPKNALLKELNCDVSSGDLSFGGFEAETVKIDSFSGNIGVDGVAKSFLLKASSGDIILKQHGKSDTIELSAFSGDVSVTAEDVGEISSETSSGKGEFSFAKAPKQSELSASSGDITIRLPENADLTANVETSSGDFSYKLNFAKEGESYVLGNGKNQMSVKASSGDVKILKLSSEN